jgi:hypothetical protein
MKSTTLSLHRGFFICLTSLPNIMGENYALNLDLNEQELCQCNMASAKVVK